MVDITESFIFSLLFRFITMQNPTVMSIPSIILTPSIQKNKPLSIFLTFSINNSKKVKNMTVIEKKIIKFKSGSYLIVLPKWWVEMNNLKKGDVVFMNPESIERITITIPTGEEEK